MASQQSANLRASGEADRTRLNQICTVVECDQLKTALARDALAAHSLPGDIKFAGSLSTTRSGQNLRASNEVNEVRCTLECAPHSLSELFTWEAHTRSFCVLNELRYGDSNHHHQRRHPRRVSASSCAGADEPHALPPCHQLHDRIPARGLRIPPASHCCCCCKVQRQDARRLPVPQAHRVPAARRDRREQPARARSALRTAESTALPVDGQALLRAADALCGVLRTPRDAQWMHREFSKDPKWTWEPDLAATALRRHNPNAVQVLQWLYAQDPDTSVTELDSWQLNTLAERCDVVAVKCLHDHKQKFTSATMDSAAAKGNLEVVQFLHGLGSDGPDCTADPMNQAAGGGHLNVVRFLHDDRDEGCTTRAMDLAAENGRLGIVKCLRENRSEGCAQAALTFAATNDHLEVVQSLHENAQWESGEGESYELGLMDKVAEAGHLNILRLLHENRHEKCTTYAMDRAASKGHLEVVRFLHEHRSEGCTTSAMDDAAACGHLEAVEFLHDNRREGCTTSAMKNAARNGHLAVAKFLHENHLGECTPQAMSEAVALNETFGVARYLFEHRKDQSMSEMSRDAAQHGNVEIFQFLLEHRGDGDVVVVPAFSSFRLDTHEVVKLLCIHVPEACSAKALNEAVGNEEHLIVRALCQYSNSRCLFEARALAVREGCANVVRRCASLETRSKGILDGQLLCSPRAKEAKLSLTNA